MRAPTLLALLLLAACAGPRSSVQAQCEQAAYDDPKVKQMLADGAAEQWLARAQEGQLHQAEQQATLRCLRARGAIAPGGVEPLRPPTQEHSLF